MWFLAMTNWEHNKNSTYDHIPKHQVAQTELQTCSGTALLMCCSSYETLLSTSCVVVLKKSSIEIHFFPLFSGGFCIVWLFFPINVSLWAVYTFEMYWTKQNNDAFTVLVHIHCCHSVNAGCSRHQILSVKALMINAIPPAQLRAPGTDRYQFAGKHLLQKFVEK